MCRRDGPDFERLWDCGLLTYGAGTLKAIDGEIETLAGTLHDSLEPVLDKPKELSDHVEQILLGLCRSLIAGKTLPSSEF